MNTTTQKSTQTTKKAAPAKRLAGHITQEPDGSFTLTGGYLAFIQSQAARLGITPDEALNQVVSKFLDKAEASSQQGAAPVVASLVVPAGVLRLAHQLDTDPDILIHQLLKLGTREVDERLAKDCGAFSSDFDAFEVNEAMGKLTAKQIEDLEDYGDTAQRVALWHIKKHRGETLNGPDPNIPWTVALKICWDAGVIPEPKEVAEGELVGAE